MLWKDWIEHWGMTGLKISLPFLAMEWAPRDPDRDAAWDLYVELITRVTTQYLAPEHGDEQSALQNIHALFELTRNTLKHRGRKAESFAKLAVVVLNQIIRPFTSKWHRFGLNGAFDDPRPSAEPPGYSSKSPGGLRS